MFSTFIFIGRSGCGKGTQAKLLQEKYAPLSSASVFYLETGARFREFLKKESYTSQLARAVSARAERQPDFLAVWMWSHFLVEGAYGEEHWVIDGTPRSLNEAKILDTALKFYGRGKISVVYIDVSRSWSTERMLARGRADDAKKDIEKRMDWFEKDVLPALDWYRQNSDYHFIQANGEQTIEKVHRDIVESL